MTSKLDYIINKIEKIERDVEELKTFKSRIIGGITVFVFITQLLFNSLLG